MVAQTSIHRVRNPKAMAAHMLVATESAGERDASPHHVAGAGEHAGAVPVVRPDMPLEVQEALALKPGRTPTRREVEALLSGRRADGRELPRARTAAASGRVQVAVVTNSADISVSIARNLCKTPEAARVFDAALRGANHEAMLDWQEHIGGHTRRGKGGRLGEEAGDIGWLTVHHRTARETRAGYAAPQEHFENIVTNVVVTASGHVGAMNLRRMRGRVADNRLVFHQALQRRLAAAGARTGMRDGYCVLPDVPRALCDAMARRSADAEANARAYAASRDLVWDDLPKGARARFIKMGARITQGSRVDGMADRAGWAKQSEAMGFPPQDLVRAPAGPGRLRVKAEAVRARATATLEAAKAMRSEARVKGQAVSSLAAAAARKRVARAVAEATGLVRDTTRAIAPPTREQREALRAKTAAVRAGTARVLRAAGSGAAQSLAAEFRVEIERYKLRQIVRAVVVGARLVGAAVGRDGPLAAQAKAIRAVAGDALQAARRDSGSFRRAYALRRFARAAREANAAMRAGQGATLPLASLRGQVAAASAPLPELPLARRAAEVRAAVAASRTTTSGPRATPARKAAKAAAPVAGRPAELPMARRAREIAAAAGSTRKAATPAVEGRKMKGEAATPQARARKRVTDQKAAKGLSVGAKRAKARPNDMATVLQEPAAAAQTSTPLTEIDSLLRTHGTPENVMRSRVRVAGIRFAKGEVGLSEATADVYATWTKLHDKGLGSKDVDPKRVSEALQDRIVEAADKHLAPVAAPAGWKEVPMDQVKPLPAQALPPLRKADLPDGQGLEA